LLVALIAALVTTVVSAQTTQSPASAGFVKEFGTMWTFDAPPLDYWQATYGFRPDQAWLDHVRLASVRLPGCSSSFVSADGLVMTNHHCARGCITQNSPADTNYQETGFTARDRSDEKPCRRTYVDQLQSIEDVTQRVRGTVTATSTVRQVEQRDSVINVIEDECNAATGLTCQVVTLFQGGMYSLYRYKRFTDVRLVTAPEGQTAFFGGDPDNFTYPRYDIDYTFFRVYENGQPYHPEHYLKWSANGAADGELVFITGNPGSTGRLLTMAQLEFLRDVQYPAQLAGLDRQLAIYQSLSARSEADHRRYENSIFGVQNTYKAVSGYLSGLQDPASMAWKEWFERDMRSRVNADRTLRAQFGRAWDEIAKAQAELQSFATEARWYGFGGGTLMGTAGILALLPLESALPDSLRLAAFRGERFDRSRAGVLAEMEVDLQAEEMFLASQLEAAAAQLPANDPYLRAVLAGRTPAAAAHALVTGTHVGDAAVRRSLVEGGAAAVDASDDPLIVAARAIAPLALRIADRQRPLNAAVSANAELVGQAIFAVYGKSIPPDATFTLRITDGVVKGYAYNGTVAPYKTTFWGLFAHAAEFDYESPWNLSPRMEAACDGITLDTPVNFVSTNDIIGGNSGSPVINRNAEVVGLVFDGNIEMLPNRFIFSDAVSRTVSVHSAALIETLRKVYGAGWVADELQGISR
jgi:hypothetical protein